MKEFSYIIEKLNHSYDMNENILKDIDFKFKNGEITGIIGPNGSGKTTLVKNLTKILQPNSGEIYLYGKDLKTIKFKELAINAGVVFQERDTEFSFTVFEIVLMGRYPYKKKFEFENANDFKIVTEALKKTNTYKYKDRLLSELSGGEKQRVLIARALAQEPNVLIFDEPISHLDLHYQMEILNLIKQLAHTKNISIIIILHDLNHAYKFCDRLMLIDKGSVFKEGTPKEVITKDNIKKVYDVNIEIIENQQKNGYHIIPAY